MIVAADIFISQVILVNAIEKLKGNTAEPLLHFLLPVFKTGNSKHQYFVEVLVKKIVYIG